MVIIAIAYAGIRIFCTEERSQGKNRERAMSLLRSKLFDLEQEKQRSEIAAQRKSQVSFCSVHLLRFHLTFCCISCKSVSWFQYCTSTAIYVVLPDAHVCTGKHSLSASMSTCLNRYADCDNQVQVGTGGRSEKIKTYNFKDSRMSDHRTKNNYDLNKMLSGAIEEPIQAMIAMEQRERLAELSSS